MDEGGKLKVTDPLPWDQLSSSLKDVQTYCLVPMVGCPQLLLRQFQATGFPNNVRLAMVESSHPAPSVLSRRQEIVK